MTYPSATFLPSVAPVDFGIWRPGLGFLCWEPGSPGPWWAPSILETSEATLHSGCSPGLPQWAHEPLSEILVTQWQPSLSVPSPALSRLALGLSGLSMGLPPPAGLAGPLVQIPPAGSIDPTASLGSNTHPGSVGRRSLPRLSSRARGQAGMPPISSPTSQFLSFLWGGGESGGSLEPVQSRKLLLDSGFRAELVLGPTLIFSP